MRALIAAATAVLRHNTENIRWPFRNLPLPARVGWPFTEMGRAYQEVSDHSVQIRVFLAWSAFGWLG
jgi:hypothetical protein